MSQRTHHIFCLLVASESVREIHFGLIVLKIKLFFSDVWVRHQLYKKSNRKISIIHSSAEHVEDIFKTVLP